MNQKSKVKLNTKIKTSKRILTILMVVMIIVFILNALKVNKKSDSIKTVSQEILRSREYEQVKPDEDKTTSKYVKFDAFFLKDIDLDGKADSIRGTCNKIGSQDTLYMELKIVDDGSLKNGRITINANNFYYNTAIVKDNEIEDNYISTNTNEIILKDGIPSGVQKLILGDVRSGDYSSATRRREAIGNDTTKYSKQNSITFTGTHVSSSGVETEISKTVYFTVDWYGEVDSGISLGNTQSVTDMDSLLTEEGLKLSFTVQTRETLNELIMSGSYINGVIPELNGYKPLSVSITGTNVEYEYDVNTCKYSAKREAEIDENGIITKNAYTSTNSSTNYLTRYNNYSFTIIYPETAYHELGEDVTNIELTIPVETYNKGYNNENPPFDNPYVSNTSKIDVTFKWKKYSQQSYSPSFNITVGKYVKKPDGTYRYEISKEKPYKIYNGISEQEKDDKYVVRWYGYTGTGGDKASMVMSEGKNEEKIASDQFVKANSELDSMEELTTNIGIYFSGASSLLGQDGWIDVINEETGEVIQRFTSSNWSSYSETNPYKYKDPVKHIKIVTSKTNAESSIYVYHIKELDDAYITEKYDFPAFEELQKIRSYLSGEILEEDKTSWYSDKRNADAYYVVPYSNASIKIKPETIATTETAEHVNIEIETESTYQNEQKWKNGSFIVKLPEEICDVEINEITISDESVEMLGYDVYEENGNYYIKILTKNDEETFYKITIDANLTPDPTTTSVGTDGKNTKVELYATNGVAVDYFYKAKDDYDVNGDLNTEEQVNHVETPLELVAPQSLITTQMASNYDKEGSVTITPKVAKVEKEQKTATVELTVTNNYSTTTSDIKIVGVIPFEGNTYLINSNELGSEFNTTIKAPGITIPEELKKYATVYYSTNANPDTNNLSNENNEWKIAEEIVDWSQIKTYMIDLDGYIMPMGQTHKFSYQIEMPSDVDYNKTSYSEHAVYFSLDTNAGKYETSTAASKLGFMIAKQYDLEIVKYQQDKDKVLPGVTFSITEQGAESGKIKVTNKDGVLKVEDLYAERFYIIKELKTTDDYVLNEEEIKIYTYTKFNEETGKEELYVTYADKNEDGTYTYTDLDKKYKEVESAETIQPEENDEYKVKIKIKLKIENEVKAKLKIVKIDGKTNENLKNVKFKIEGQGKEGNILTTNAEGEIELAGLYLGKEYTLTETKAKGYYIPSPIKFTITNNNGTFNLEVEDNDNTVIENKVEEIDSIPIINLKIQNEKIPTYSIELTKYARNEYIEEGGTQKTLKGAQFKIVGDGLPETGKIYTTNESGILRIDDLYEYVEGKDIQGIYTISEIYAPEGYTLNINQLKFRAQRNKENKLEIQILDGTGLIRTISEGEGTEENTKQDLTIINPEGENPTINFGVEDSQIFSLYKTDEETNSPIEGVKFIITDTDGNPAKGVDGNYIGTLENIDGQDYYTFTTDSEGKITANLPEGLYKAIEVWVPEKYLLEEDEAKRTYYFGIGASKPGSVDWANSSLGSGWNQMKSIISTNDGGAVGVGEIYEYQEDLDPKKQRTNGTDLNKDGANEEFSKGYKDAVVVKYDFQGNYVWSKSIGGTKNDVLKKVIETKDEGLIVVGYTQSKKVFISGIEQGSLGRKDKLSKKDAIMIKLDKDGNFEWGTRFGGDLEDNINSVIETSEGDIVVVGSFYSETFSFYNKDGIEEATISSKGKKDGFIASYTKEGNINWQKGIGGTDDIEVVDVTETSKGLVIAVNYFDTVYINDSTSVRGSTYDCCGLLVEYTLDGTYSWYSKIFTDDFSGNGNSIDGDVNLTSIDTSIKDEIIVSVNYTGLYIKGGENAYPWGKRTSDTGLYDGAVLKFSNRGKKAGLLYTLGGNREDYISDVVAMEDGGVLLGGWYYSSEAIDVDKDETTDGEYDLPPATGESDGYVIKLNQEGKVEYSSRLYGDSFEGVNSVEDRGKSGILATGFFGSNSLTATNTAIEQDEENENEEQDKKETKILDGVGNDEGFVVSVGANDPAVPELQELRITNKIKTFKITTEVKEINGTRGGKITGEGQDPYEVVKYKEDSNHEIKLEPDPEYAILSVTVNGVEFPFEEETDGTYTMPFFEEMTEDKHIVVTYIIKKNKITIVKEDSNTHEPLPGAKFKLDQIEEREDPEGAIKEYTDNGQEYVKPNELNEVTGSVLGTLTNNEKDQYHFVMKDEKYVPTNSKTYLEGTGKSNSTAHSYIPIDLKDKTGKYVVVVNASIDSESFDHGYAVVDQSTDMPKQKSHGEFFNISGTSSTVKQQKDYISASLDGGNNYNLHFCYYKDSSSDSGTDQLVIYSVKVYEANVETYQFVPSTENADVYESNNQQKDNTVANSYVKIDLSKQSGKYNLIVNAQISSANGDYGYATVTKTPDRVDYNSNTSDRFINITSNQDAKDYTKVLEGGYVYYLHLGYYKNSSESEGDDKFTINSIKLTLNDSELNHFDIETNEAGKAILELPFGKYNLTEVEAPDGYILKEEPDVIEFREGEEDKKVIITNTAKSKVNVNHYLWKEDVGKTTDEVAEGSYLEGKIGENYTSSPNRDLVEYELITNKDYYGDEVPEGLDPDAPYIPSNATGEYKEEEQTVDYYYKEKVYTYKLTVHHYIENTEERVPSLDGNTVKDEITEGYKMGAHYTTKPITDSSSDQYADIDQTKYELVEESIPLNKEGEIEGDTEVIYYYRLKDSAGVKVHHYLVGTGPEFNEEINSLAEDEILPKEGIAKVGDDYQTNPSSEVLGKNYVIATNEDFYGKTEDEALQRLQKLGLDYETVEQFLKEKYNGISYDEFKVRNYIPLNAKGTYAEEEIEVTYYYKLKDVTILDNNKIEKEGTDVIKQVGDQVSYEINYEVTIDEYIGNATVKIVDTLPYEIDTDKPYDLDGGKYSSEDRTITWEKIAILDIDTYKYKQDHPEETGYTIRVTKNIKLSYKDADTSKTIINKVKGKTTLISAGNKETQEVEAQKETLFVTDVRVKKIWDKGKADTEVEKSARPTSIKVKVKNGETVVEEIILSEKQAQVVNVKTSQLGEIIPLESEWEYVFKNLPKFDEKGNEITYTVTEEEVTADDFKFYRQQITEKDTNVGEGQETTQSSVQGKNAEKLKGTGEHEFEIKNIYDPQKEENNITIDVTKTWVGDEENAKRKERRPDSIIVVVKIYGQEGFVQKIKLSENKAQVIAPKEGTEEILAESWKYTIKDLPKYDLSGNEITYTIDEEESTTDELKFYSKQVTGTIEEGFIITNTFQVPKETTSFDVTKIWQDDEDKCGKRPKQIEVQVLNDEEKVTSETLDVNDKKVSEQIEQLNGKAKTTEITDESIWKHTFEKLNKYDEDGQEINYTVQEQEVTPGDLSFYKDPEISGNMKDGYTITNTILLEDTKITKTGTTLINSKDDQIEYNIEYVAVLNDFTGQAHIQVVDTLPYKIKDQIDLAGGEYSDDPIPKITWDLTINTDIQSQEVKIEGTKKTITISKKIKLTYKDIDVKDEQSAITNKVEGNLIIDGKKDTVENTFETKTKFKVNIKVRKEWVGVEDVEDQIERPKQIAVQLKADGNNFVDTESIKGRQVLNNDNSWQYIWENLDRYNRTTGEEIVYTVEEVEKLETYDVNVETHEYQITQGEEIPTKNIVVTNTLKKANFEFKKVANENNETAIPGTKFELYRLVCKNSSHTEENHNNLIDTDYPGSCWKKVEDATSQSKDGMVSFENLVVGKEYRLVETKAALNRVKPEGQWKIEFTPNEAKLNISSVGEVSSPEFITQQDGTLLLPNMQMYNLPLTGGRGVKTFVIVGISFLLLGGTVILIQNKKQNKI